MINTVVITVVLTIMINTVVITVHVLLEKQIFIDITQLLN